MDFLNDVMFWREALTVFCFALFLSICLWAYSKNRQKEFDDISAMVIQDDDLNGSVIPVYQTGRKESADE